MYQQLQVFLFHSVNYLSLLLSRCNTNSVGHGMSVARYYETTCVYQLNSCAQARVRLWWARPVSVTKALQNWKSSVKAYQNDLSHL